MVGQGGGHGGRGRCLKRGGIWGEGESESTKGEGRLMGGRGGSSWMDGGKRDGKNIIISVGF